MSGATWSTIGGLAVVTFAIKAVGPVLFGGRDLPQLLARIVPLLAPTLLAALVLVETFAGSGRSLTIDARAGGLGIAAVALVRRVPLIAVVVLAAASTALIRVLT
jgi:branched-subunit amino acid transport protein